MLAPDSGPSPPSRRERERQRDIQDILVAAAAEFAEQGFAHTTMQRIAERAEFSVGKLYKYFEGKEALYRALHRLHSERLDSRLEAVVDDGTSPLALLRRQMQAAIEYFNEHADFMLIYARDATLKADQEIQEHKQTHEQEITELLGRAMDQGEIAREDPQLLGALILGVMERLFISITLRGEGRPNFDAVGDLIDRIVFDPLVERAKRES